MKELEVQKLLRGTDTADGLNTLLSFYGVVARRHGRYPNLIGLTYDTRHAPRGVRITEECRGLILDESDDWHVAARPFDRFYNYGEKEAAEIDWACAWAEPKHDGSLIIGYWYNGEWHFATRGTPDGSGEMGATKRSYGEIAAELAAPLTPHWDINRTYMFELVSPRNQIVLQYQATELRILAVRHILTGLWTRPLPAFDYLRVQSPDDVFSLMQNEDGLIEGFVVCDGHGSRVKFKNEDYVRLHRLRDGFTDRAIMQAVLDNETDEILALFPGIRHKVAKAQQAYDRVQYACRTAYMQHLDPDRKTFALRVKDLPIAPALFAGYRSPDSSIKGVYDYLAAHVDKVLEWSKL